MTKTISVMIPTYNEEENVTAMYEAVRDIFVSDLPQYHYEILFIDNKSKDRTRELITAICGKDPQVRAIFNTRNFGQFNSPYFGLTQTSGDCTIVLCADFQDPVELLPTFVHEWENGWKIVCGIKSASKENPILYFLRSGYYKLLHRMSDVDIIENFTGFGLYDKSFITVLRDLDDPTPFFRGIVAELGPERKIIEYTQKKRRAGKTHNNMATLYDAAMLSFTSYTKFGLRIATIAGFFMSVVSFLVGMGYLVYKLCYWDRFTPGIAPLVVGMFFLGAVQILFIGFLGEYLLSINARMMNRPLVVVEKRLNFPTKVQNNNE